jgi:hypothetical protein
LRRSYFCSSSRPRAAVALHAAVQLAAGLAELDQVLHRGDELAVVPGLGEVIGGAGLDQVRPRRPGASTAVSRMTGRSGWRVRICPKQRHAFLARGGVGAEVHVLHHQVDVVAASIASPSSGVSARNVSMSWRENSTSSAVATEGVVVDDEDGRHGR